MCLVSNCGLFKAFVDRCMKCFQKFCVFRKTFWMSPFFSARIFNFSTSVTPILKSFLLQPFFRETLNGQSIEKKTLTTTFPNNLRSIRSVADSVGKWQGWLVTPVKEHQQKTFVLKASSDLQVRISKTQWLT